MIGSNYQTHPNTQNTVELSPGITFPSRRLTPPHHHPSSEWLAQIPDTEIQASQAKRADVLWGSPRSGVGHGNPSENSAALSRGHHVQFMSVYLDGGSLK